MPCPNCTGPSRDGLCRTCEIDEEREFYERRAEEMREADQSGGDDGGD